jgi:asparagine synthase (glutamine-hydrolysing)
MCGIAGILSLNKSPIAADAIKKMCDVISYRGPDDAGYALFSMKEDSHGRANKWLELTDNNFKHKNVHLAPIQSDYAKQEIASNDWHLVFGHRRLAIIDLTVKAHQPMSDSRKRVWLIFNGEIYNFLELRGELEAKGYSFSSKSDTEVIIFSYLAWGIDCIRKFNGMFAFALWDNDTNKLFLARDRYGIKPLYYTLTEGTLTFASEIKAILNSTTFTNPQVNSQVLNEYFTFQNVFTDRTLFKGIMVLPPGSFMEVDINRNPQEISQIHQYWDYKFSDNSFNLSEAETTEEIRRLFIQSVKREIVSDVPLGSYLSGGMDTGSITALVRKYLGRISTFTCGFDLTSASGLELGFDERKFAEIMANELKTEHYEVVLHAGDMEAVMPELIWHLEDLRLGQCYPNYYVARLAGKFVRVVLSGAGGDELFAGYPWRYYRGINAKNRDDYLKRYYEYWQRLVTDEEKKDFFRPEIYHEIENSDTFNIFRSVFDAGGLDPKNNDDYVNASLYFEIKTFLRGLFIVEDKVSMAQSLETRLPFLDNDLVDFAMKIPPRMKLNNLNEIIKMDEDEPGKLRKYYQMTLDGKNVLRKSMQGLVPGEILKREKQGFSAPDASWFRGESIEYIRSLLYDPEARIYQFLNPNFVRKKFEEHTAGKINHRLLIWSLLSFEWWLRQFVMK